MKAQPPPPERLELASLALGLLAVDPFGLGGAVLRMGPGPETDEWLNALRNALGSAAPWRRLPAGIDDDRLLGGLDMAASLSAGKPLLATGLLVEADGGTVVLPMAERLPRGTAARLAAVMDRGAVLLERDGMTRSLPTRFCLVALDEAREDEDGLSPDLADRLALHLGSADFLGRHGTLQAPDTHTIITARQRLAEVRCPPELLTSLCGIAQALGIDSIRPSWFAQRVACAAAALDGRLTVTEDDVALALRLVLAPRATQLPPPPEEEADETPPDEQQAQDQAPPEDSEAPPNNSALPQELVLEAVKAALPPGLVAELVKGAGRRRSTTRVARGGPPARAVQRGRPIGEMRGDPRRGHRLHLPATLKAAAPWQTIRRRTDPAQRDDSKATTAPTVRDMQDEASLGSAQRQHRRQNQLQVRSDDFRVKRLKANRQTTRIFVVDASGSAAAQRLAETKGAVELLLAESYATRDQVALIAFRGTGAEILLPPTRALARAKRELAGLPGGGGTPLAAGLHAARELATDLARREQHPVIILMTDGRANVCLDGETGHGPAGEEALAAARLLRAGGWDTLLVDTSRRPRPRARDLADALGARYLPLPQANAGRLSAAASALEA